MLVASVALIGASIAAFTSIYSAASRTSAAVVLVRPVAQGQLITPADLGEAQVTVSAGVGDIPLDEASVVSGKRAVAAMPAGSLLTVQDLTDAPAVPPDGAVVGVALRDGAYPTPGLSPGDQVLVVQTAAPGSPVAAPDGATSGSIGTPGPTTGSTGVTVSGTSGTNGTSGTDGGVLVPRAMVFAVTAPSSSSSSGATLLVSLEVPSDLAAEVATASAAGQVGLVLLPPSADAGSGSSAAGASAAEAAAAEAAAAGASAAEAAAGSTTTGAVP